MNSKTTPGTSPEKIESKCPFSWMIRKWKLKALTFLDTTNQELNTLNNVSVSILNNFRKINFLKEINKHTDVLRAESQQIQDILRGIVKHEISKINFSDNDLIFLAKSFQRNGIGNAPKQNSSKEEKLQHLSYLLALAMLDIFTILMLNRNFWISQDELKNIIRIEMMYGDANNIPTNKILNFIDYEKDISVDKILSHLKDWYRNKVWKQKIASCSFFDSELRDEWIDGIWEVLEDKFLPEFKKVFRTSSRWDKESHFYLERYNEIEK